MSALQIHLLGGLQLLRGGHRLAPFPTQKSRALFAFLALNRGRLFARDVLAGIFWGDRPEAVARKCLRTDLWRVRGVVEVGRGAEEACLRVEGDEIGFQAGDDHWLDVAEFELCAQVAVGRSGADLGEEEAERLARAVEIYRGDLLDGVYDDWCVYERERLRLMFLRALEGLMRFRQAREEWGEAIALGQRLLVADPLREQVHRDLMRCFLQEGDRAAALKQFSHCERLMRAELDVEPMEETRALRDRIRSTGRVARIKPESFPPTLRLIPGPVPPLLDQVESILASLYAATRHLEETRDLLTREPVEARHSVAS
jgi:DNA-binding SARP family transcriptional activator